MLRGACLPIGSVVFLAHCRQGGQACHQNLQQDGVHLRLWYLAWFHTRRGQLCNMCALSCTARGSHWYGHGTPYYAEVKFGIGTTLASCKTKPQSERQARECVIDEAAM